MSFLGFGRGDNAVRPLTYTRMNLPGQPVQSEAERTSLLGHSGGTNLEALFADPAAQAYMRTMSQYGTDSPQGRAARTQLERRMDQLGASLPPHARFATGPNGQIGYQQTDINNDYVYPIATLVAAGGLGLGAASAAGAFSGGAAGSAGATAPSVVGAGNGVGIGGTGLSAGVTGLGGTTGSATAAGAFGGTGGSIAGTGGFTGGMVPAGVLSGSVGGPAAAGAAGSFTSPGALGIYSTIAQSAIQAIAARSAARQQQEASAQALALQRDILNQQRQNEQPYMDAGNAALQRLNLFLTPQGQAVPQISGSSKDQMVLVTSPNGESQLRPTSEIPHWQSLGATIGPAQSYSGTTSVQALQRQPVSAHGGF